MISSTKKYLLFWILMLAACVPVHAADVPDDQAYDRITKVASVVLNQDATRLYTVVKQWNRRAEIVRVDLATGEPEVLFSPLDGSSSGAFPDNQEKRLAFTSDAVGDERHKLHILDIESGAYRVPTPRGQLDIPCAFSPDGTYVYAVRGEHIWGKKRVVRIDTTSGQATTLFSEGEASMECSDISEDGGQLLIRRYVTNNEWHLGLLNLDSGIAQWLLREEGLNVKNAVFHAGSIYFLSNRQEGKMRLWAYGPDAELRRVPIPVTADLQAFTFNQAGYLKLAYRGALKPVVALFRLLENGDWQPIPVGPEAEELTMLEIAATTADRFVTATEGGRPPRFHVVENGKPRLLLDTNETGLPEQAFARTRSLLIESFDGTKIPTHILVPSAATADTPLPMVLYVHGGPEDHVDPVYSSNYQRLANAGYVVVIPNVRGSTGFGQAYMNMDNGDWGGAHIRDLLAVADYAAGLDFVADRPRFIMGGSFGGFSVLSAIFQYPGAFDGAVDYFGVADIEKFIAGLTDQIRPSFIGLLGFDPAEDPERARAISPVYHADRIDTPLQIHQGIHDPRVLPEQSRAVAEALRKRGVGVEYFEYEEGHGFVHPENEHLSRERIIRFFSKLHKSYQAGL